MKMKRSRERSGFGPSSSSLSRRLITKHAEAQRRKLRAHDDEQLVLDGRMWRRLPEDVLLRVLAFLPLHKQLELRTVCKSWRDLFSQSRNRLALSSWQWCQRETWLVVILRHPPKWWDVEGDLPKLLALCPNYLPPKVHEIDNNPTVNNNRGSSYIQWRWSGLPPRAAVAQECMGSTGGLMVHYCRDTHSFVVFNPLTNAAKSVCCPPMADVALRNGEHQVEMTMLTLSAGTYHLVVMTQGYLEVYNSRSCSWKAFAMPNSRSLMYDFERGSWHDQWAGQQHFKTSTGTAHCHSILDDDVFMLDEKAGVMYSFNTHTCMWSIVKTSLPSCSGKATLALPTIVKCKGRILLVGCLAVKGQEVYTVAGLGVWEWKLDGIGQQGSSEADPTWVEVATTPHDLWQPPPGRFYKYMCYLRCHVVLDNLICITGVDYTDLDIGVSKFWTPLTYDVDCGSWGRLPSYEGGIDYVGFFTFQPSWIAVP